ncbi:hypothetical protein HDU91_001851, partial [Kappamyces sp. JEL0680]
NQQPILQSQSFTTQPKTYQLYENYRNFVLAKAPKRFRGVASNLAELLPSQKEGSRDRKLDYWLDDEDMEEESPALYWRSKAASPLQPQGAQTSDFLARLATFTIKSSLSLSRNSKTDTPLISVGAFDNQHSAKSTAANSLTGLSHSSTGTPSVDPIPILGGNIHSRRKSIAVVQHTQADWKRQELSLSHSFRDIRAASSTSPPGFSPFGYPFERKSMELPRPPTPKKMLHKRVASDGDNSPSSALLGHTPLALSWGEGRVSIGEDRHEDAAGMSYGTIVFVNDFGYLNGPHPDIAFQSQEVAKSLGRPDLEQVWSCVELVVDANAGLGTAWRRLVARHVLRYLFQQRDFQTLSMVLCLFHALAVRSSADEAVVPVKSFVTSSPALYYRNARLRAVSSEADEQKRKSKLRQYSFESFTGPPSSSYGLPISSKFAYKPAPAGGGETYLLEPLLADHERELYSNMVLNYSNYLYQLGLFIQRAQLLKACGWVHCVNLDRSSRAGLVLEFPTIPQDQDAKPSDTPGDSRPNRSAHKCSLCRLSVKGLSMYCSKCRHGGHMSCMRRAFA